MEKLMEQDIVSDNIRVNALLNSNVCELIEVSKANTTALDHKVNEALKQTSEGLSKKITTLSDQIVSQTNKSVNEIHAIEKTSIHNKDEVVQELKKSVNTISSQIQMNRNDMMDFRKQTDASSKKLMNTIDTFYSDVFTKVTEEEELFIEILKENKASIAAIIRTESENNTKKLNKIDQMLFDILKKQTEVLAGIKNNRTISTISLAVGIINLILIVIVLSGSL